MEHKFEPGMWVVGLRHGVDDANGVIDEGDVGYIVSYSHDRLEFLVQLCNGRKIKIYTGVMDQFVINDLPTVEILA